MTRHYPGGWKAPKTNDVESEQGQIADDRQRSACEACHASGAALFSFTLGRGFVDCAACGGFGYLINGKAPS